MNDKLYTSYTNENEVLLTDGVPMSVTGVDEEHVIVGGKHEG